MSNPNRNPKLNWNIVRKARNMYKNDKTLTIKDVARKFGISLSAMYKVIYNQTWRDPNYEEPSAIAPGWGRMAAIEPKRKPANEYPFNCHICGMGYETKEEASDCCKRQREVDNRAGDTGEREGKWGDTKGNPMYKYIIWYDLMGRRRR